jgi:hypothetical protein
MDFVLTSDLDWASEYCIAHFLEFADRYAIKPTLFVTHRSDVALDAARDGRAELGIHPNFLPGSSQGDDEDAILNYLLEIVPRPAAIRCHRYSQSAAIADALAKRGLNTLSNSHRHLEIGIESMQLANGSLSLPVFFEDDVHWERALPWSFAGFAAPFFSPGLKILNFHPFFVALNVPDRAFYKKHHSRIPHLSPGQANELRYTGSGAATFLHHAVEAVLAAGHRFVTLGEVAHNERTRRSDSRD